MTNVAVVACEPLTEPIARVPARRNHTFDLMRIGFALLVILSHAAEITDGDRSREPAIRIFHSGFTCGMMAVDGFFLLSGYLILASWLSDPRPASYLQKRILRIVPGYVVCVVATTCVLGVVAPAAPGFFSHLLNAGFLTSVLTLGSPVTPPLFPSLHWHILNGSLFTITYEFSCYLVVMLLGLLGLASRRFCWLALTGLCLAFFTSGVVNWNFPWHGRALFLTQRFLLMFLIGGCYWHFRSAVPLQLRFALIAAGALVACLFFPILAEPAFAIFGSYLLFFLGSKDSAVSAGIANFPDISYGIYLYGWPVLCLVIWLLHPSLWLTIAMSSIFSAGLAWLSWHYVERPMLKMKKRPSARLAHS